MAKFVKKERRLVLEFDNIKIFVDVLNEKVQKALQEFSNKKEETKDIKVLTDDMFKLLNIILGKDNLENIKAELYAGGEWTFFELLDICEYVLEEINNYNLNIKEYNLKIINKYK